MNLSSLHELRNDPIKMFAWLWPDDRLYDLQREALWSVRRNDRTVIVAGNMLGKDYLAGRGCVIEYLSHPVARIVTTSVKDDHLRVLWGEIGRAVQTARHQLTTENGGPLLFNHRDVRKVVKGQVDPISYLRGMVSERGEGMAGHHAPYTLGVADEASGIPDLVFTQMETWARKLLVFGNPNPPSLGCTLFKAWVKAGDQLALREDRQA